MNSTVTSCSWVFITLQTELLIQSNTFSNVPVMWCIHMCGMEGCWGGRRRQCLDSANFTGNYHELQSYILEEGCV